MSKSLKYIISFFSNDIIFFLFAYGLANNSWVSAIRGALTVPVISQFLLIWDAMLHVQLSPGVEDRLLIR